MLTASLIQEERMTHDAANPTTTVGPPTDLMNASVY